MQYLDYYSINPKADQESFSDSNLQTQSVPALGITPEYISNITRAYDISSSQFKRLFLWYHAQLTNHPTPTYNHRSPPSQSQSQNRAMESVAEDRGANRRIENFTGADGQSAVRWLRCFTREQVTRRDGTPVTSGLWLEEIDGYLEGEAERWADRTPVIRELLDKNTLDQRTTEDIERFWSLFLDHFKVETESFQENTIPLIQSLYQQPTESLLIYH